MPGRLFEDHQTVQHGRNEYVRGQAHTNTVEGHLSQLKRLVDGTHHQVSRRHVHRYLSEFGFRYNTPKVTDGERTVRAVRQTVGRRLMYDKVAG